MRVIVAGLDQDYLRRPFGPMPALLALAEYVDKMHAVCVVCGAARALHASASPAASEQVQVGDSESYEARCRPCYEQGLAQARAAVEAGDLQKLD